MSPADRRAMVGRGLAGGVIRNLLLDMHRQNVRRRQEEPRRNARGDLNRAALRELRATDPWEQLQSTLRDVFQCELEVAPFNDLYHNYIRVRVARYDAETRRRVAGVPPRDLMAEGSGFLQWLSVYTLALNPDVDVILLDEPDAHLHPSLQTKLVEKLGELSGANGKQVLLATHSTEILRWAAPDSVLAFGSGSIKYLDSDEQKIGLFVGLGSDYAPKLDPLRRHGRLLIVENYSDADALRLFSERLGREWPENLVVWPWTGGNKERKQFYQQVKREVRGLKALGIRDRDDNAMNTVDPQTLRDKGMKHKEPNLLLRTWRRRHIESYLLWPAAIARAARRGIDEVEAVLREQGLAIPPNFAEADVPAAVLDARGKEIFNVIKRRFGVTPSDVIRVLTPDEVPRDVQVIISQIIELCSDEANALLAREAEAVDEDEPIAQDGVFA